MKFSIEALLVVACLCLSSCISVKNPVGRSLELIQRLERDVQATGEAEASVQKKFEAWCSDTLKSARKDVREAESRKRELEALVAKAANDAEMEAGEIASFAGAEPTAESKSAFSERVGSKASIEQRKAQAELDLASSAKDLSSASEYADKASRYCSRTVGDLDAAAKARGHALNAIAGAEKSLASIAGGGSMLMIDGAQQSSDPERATNLVRRLAFRQESSTLAQLATNMEAVIRLGGLTGEDILGKVKGLLRDMIVRLESEQNSEVTEKQFCDEQLATSSKQRAALEGRMKKHAAKTDQASARLEELGEELKETYAELAALARSQSAMDALRQEQQSALSNSKAVFESGMTSVQQAVIALRDFGSGGGVTDLLEVTESALASCLTAVNLGEDGGASGYNQMTQVVSITKAVKEKDVKYLTREQTSLSREGSEAKGDLGSMSEELNAASDYEEKLKQRCVAKPDSYEERKRRREEELQGLQEALNLLSNDGVAFVQWDAASIPNLADEAADVSRFMENVRAKTEAGGASLDAKPTAVLPPSATAKEEEVANPHEVPALDAELMAKADQVAREMQISSAVGPVAKPPAALVKRSQATVQRRLGHSHAAARFFAMHGMTQIGRLLGEELSDSERDNALREQAQAMRVLDSKPSSRTFMSSRSSDTANTGGSTDDLDLAMAEDEDERADQAHWQAVDKLKHHRPQQI
mmetsp:Transcript_126272/g.252271  ORF Transcript_126272/g.252271 Transcript_126272/m.252271 type:complete len:705 (-) Transcript_126272:106-2220(-)|eukprot:CAMPEP_0172668638 /NCGR_PEP_ID=MMETSP1074-20121228/9180_1 /TAXON_ID=2916 /ORGANISM="Ceratium fusus, Strain PA161109" /LENGTH=704 /DNA_ID=CAMNT_0013485305 /DNA_START=58 /DNA_END=2172 /DNA_ORIENTATION=+